MSISINAQHLTIYQDPKPFRRQEDPVRDNVVDDYNDDNQIKETNADLESGEQKPQKADKLNNEDIKTEHDDTAYDVERLLARKSFDGKIHYECKCIDRSAPTWESIENIGEHLIDEYHTKYTKQGKRRERERQGYLFFSTETTIMSKVSTKK